MPSDDYASFGGGALKLKGGKVKKHKKKKDKGADLGKSLSIGESSSRTADGRRKEIAEDDDRKTGTGTSGSDDEKNAGSRAAPQTEAERRFAEARRKKVGAPCSSPSPPPPLRR